MLRSSTLACVVVSCAACAPPAERGGFDSGNPASSLYAIEYAMRDNDLSKTPCIIEQLDSDDPAVRFLAIAALRQMWGMDLGYHCDAPPWLRGEAVQRWVDAEQSGMLSANVTTGAADG